MSVEPPFQQIFIYDDYLADSLKPVKIPLRHAESLPNIKLTTPTKHSPECFRAPAAETRDQHVLRAIGIAYAYANRIVALMDEAMLALGQSAVEGEIRLGVPDDFAANSLTPYLADKAYWDQNYGEQADWLRPDGSDAITGFMTQITLTGGFANKTLFDQAGVALPAAGSSWDQWVEAAQQAAKSSERAARAMLRRLSEDTP